MSYTKQDTARAFVQGQSASCHNAHTDGNTYTLHKSDIVRRLPRQSGYQFDWCGFYTRTTASHMNEVLKALGSPIRVSYAQARDEKTVAFIVNRLGHLLHIDTEIQPEDTRVEVELV